EQMAEAGRVMEAERFERAGQDDRVLAAPVADVAGAMKSGADDPDRLVVRDHAGGARGRLAGADQAHTRRKLSEIEIETDVRPVVRRHDGIARVGMLVNRG